MTETREERIARLGEVRNGTTGKQSVFPAKIRIGRYGPVTDVRVTADNATHVVHYELDIEDKHADLYIEPKELLEHLEQLEVLK